MIRIYQSYMKVRNIGPKQRRYISKQIGNVDNSFGNLLVSTVENNR